MKVKKLLPIIIFLIAIIFLFTYYKDYIKQVKIIHETNKISDMSEYKKINKNTVSYIKIEGTKVDFPIVQYKDNNYYLKHSFNNSKNKYGWIFMDYRNDSFNDMNTIIYGHTIDNNLMFASLKNILGDNSIDEIKIYENEKVIKYQIFSIYIIDPINDYLRMNFTEDEYRVFLKDITQRSIYNYNINPNENDKIITLSTCYKDEKRLVIHALRK